MDRHTYLKAPFMFTPLVGYIWSCPELLEAGNVLASWGLIWDGHGWSLNLPLCFEARYSPQPTARLHLRDASLCLSIQRK